jgi:hypothetical protein
MECTFDQTILNFCLGKTKITHTKQHLIWTNQTKSKLEHSLLYKTKCIQFGALNDHSVYILLNNPKLPSYTE